VPEGFVANEGVQALLAARKASLADERGRVDWATAEALAFGTLMMHRWVGVGVGVGVQGCGLRCLGLAGDTRLQGSGREGLVSHAWGLVMMGLQTPHPLPLAGKPLLPSLSPSLIPPPPHPQPNHHTTAPRARTPPTPSWTTSLPPRRWGGG